MSCTLTGTIFLSSAQRLVNGSNQYSGRLEVLHKGAWLPVAAYNASHRATIAAKVCQMMGFIGANSSAVESPEAFGLPTPNVGWLNMTRCIGSETVYTECLCSPDAKYDAYKTTCDDRRAYHSVEALASEARALAANQVAVSCPAPGKTTLE